MLYSILVFLHVLAGIGIFVVLGIESVALSRFQRADTTLDAATWLGVLGIPRRLGAVVMLTMLVTGVWMTARTWGPQPWIVAALSAVVVVAILGGVLTGRSMRRIGRAFAEESDARLSPAFRALRNSTALGVSLRMRASIAVGIIGLMTMKPGVAESLVVMLAAVALGTALSLPVIINGLAPGRGETMGVRAGDPR